MTTMHDLQMPRRLLARMVVETLVAIGLLVAVYVFIPIDTDTGTVWSIAFGALLVGVVVIVAALHQVRRVERSRAPLATGVQALILLLTVFVLGFSFLYVSIATAAPDTFSEPLDRFDAIYLTVTILATVGFGDITAVSTGARMAVTVQMLVGLGFVAGFIRLIFGTAQRAHQRRHPDPPVAN